MSDAPKFAYGDRVRFSDGVEAVLCAANGAQPIGSFDAVRFLDTGGAILVEKHWGAPPGVSMIAMTPEKIEDLARLLGQEGGAHPGWDVVRDVVANGRGER